MTVRVKQLALWGAPITSTPQTIYTVPAGFRTIWKFGTIQPGANMEMILAIWNGVQHFQVYRQVMGFPTVYYPSVYVVLHANQELRIYQVAAGPTTAAVSLHGPELLL